MDCLFCKIIDGDIPSTKVYEDEYVFAFKDIAPIAPVHYLIIPKAHISGADEITEENSSLVAKVFEAAAKIAKTEGIESFRIINNCMFFDLNAFMRTCDLAIATSNTFFDIYVCDQNAHLLFPN